MKAARRFFAAAVMFGVISGGDLAGEVRIDDLMSACSKGSPVVERVEGRMQIVGEQLDPFCRGYLLGAYESMLAEGELKATADVSPEYLKSVVERFRLDRPEDSSGSAQGVLRLAFRRAFPLE